MTYPSFQMKDGKEKDTSDLSDWWKLNCAVVECLDQPEGKGEEWVRGLVQLGGC